MEALNIRVGKNSSWIVPEDQAIASIRATQRPVNDLSAAINSALSNPLDFPPLDQALVPGDQLVLVVDPHVPALAELISGIVRWFVQQGTPASNIRVVLAADGSWPVDQLASEIERLAQLSICVEGHDLDDAEKIAYVAANEASDAIYLNRVVVDADVVIPITCARPQSSLDYFGSFGLFPLLSNRATRGEFYQLPRLEEPTAHAALQSWADQAAWWVGVLVGIQVIPSADGGVAKVLAGQLPALEEAVQLLMADVWGSTDCSGSELVVSVLDGNANSQSWLTVARVLHSALRWVTPRGSIVIASDLNATIGKGLGRLKDPHHSPEAIAKKLASDNSDDALAAAVILSAIHSHHVYLISQMRHETVENLGLGVITDAAQLAHLVSQHTSCTIIEAAQHRILEPCPA